MKRLLCEEALIVSAISVLLGSALVSSVKAASMWSRTYGTGNSWACSMVATFDGGYAIAGTTNGDYWLLKTDASGNTQWNQTYGGTGRDWSCSVVEASDGVYAIAGMWNCTNFEMGLEYFGTAYFGDFWLVKTDENGFIPEYSSALIPALVLTATVTHNNQQKTAKPYALKSQAGTPQRTRQLYDTSPE